MNSSKNTKKYEELSTRANNVLLNAGFKGDKEKLTEILSGMSLHRFSQRYKNGGKVTYLELRKWCGLGDDWFEDPRVSKTEISFSSLTLPELLDLCKYGDFSDFIEAKKEVIRRFDSLAAHGGKRWIAA